MINLSDKPAEEFDMNIKRVGIDLAKQIFQDTALMVHYAQSAVPLDPQRQH